MPLLDFRCSFLSPPWAGQGEITKIVIVAHMGAFSCRREPHFERVGRRLTKGRVFYQVVYLVSPDTEVVVEISERPDSLLLWLNLLRHLPNPLHDLGIAQKIMHELGISRPKQPFAYRAVAWFRPGARFLGAAVVGCQCFKVGTVKLSASVNDQDLGQSAIPPDTLPQQHHAGTVARRIKREIDCEQPPRKRIHQKRGPGPTERTTSARADQFYIKFGMVEVPDFEWSITMFGSCSLQFPYPGLQRSRSSFSLSFEDLLMSGTLLDTLPQGLVTGDDC